MLEAETMTFELRVWPLMIRFNACQRHSMASPRRTRTFLFQERLRPWIRRVTRRLAHVSTLNRLDEAGTPHDLLSRRLDSPYLYFVPPPESLRLTLPQVSAVWISAQLYGYSFSDINFVLVIKLIGIVLILRLRTVIIPHVAYPSPK